MLINTISYFSQIKAPLHVEQMVPFDATPKSADISNKVQNM